MATKTLLFDAAKYLTRPETQAELLTDAFSSGEPAYIANALGIIARARGTREVVETARVSRAALYKALSPDGDPRFSALIGVARALSIEISAKAVRKRSGNRKKKVAARCGRVPCRNAIRRRMVAALAVRKRVIF